MNRLRISLLAWVLLIAGCSEFDYASDRHLREGAVVAEPQGGHIVQQGDTLYQIAWAYGVDFRDIAAWNGISAPYTIYPGQRLVLRAGQRRSTAVTSSSSVPAPSSAGNQRTVRAEPLTGPIAWQWPHSGRIVRSYNANALGKRGVGIAGQPGSTVVAAAAGDVVYSGSGLRGYGNLIIIKHSDRFLTAYGYNQSLLVSEGTRVAAGDAIARMGSSANRDGELHFEIREQGEPVNPAKYLP